MSHDPNMIDASALERAVFLFPDSYAEAGGDAVAALARVYGLRRSEPYRDLYKPFVGFRLVRPEPEADPAECPLCQGAQMLSVESTDSKDGEPAPCMACGNDPSAELDTAGGADALSRIGRLEARADAEASARRAVDRRHWRLLSSLDAHLSELRSRVGALSGMLEIIDHQLTKSREEEVGRASPVPEQCGTCRGLQMFFKGDPVPCQSCFNDPSSERLKSSWD